MKKLVVLLAGVAFAAVTQAANMNWAISNVKTPADSSVSGSGYYVALFATSVSGDTLGGFSTVSKDALVAAFSKGDFSLMSSAAKTGATNSSGAITGVAFTGVGTTSADSITAFAIIFDNADYTKATNFIVTDDKNKTVAVGAASGGSLAFGSQATATWTAVAPEPTSGLLMLVGLGALALRRRRA